MTAFGISKESDSLAVDDNLVGVPSENVSPTDMQIDSSIEAPTTEDNDKIDTTDTDVKPEVKTTQLPKRSSSLDPIYENFKNISVFSEFEIQNF